MSILSDLVVTSATAAFAHFGVTLDLPDQKPEPPAAERTVMRSETRTRPAPLKSHDCPDKAPAPRSARETA